MPALFNEHLIGMKQVSRIGSALLIRKIRNKQGRKRTTGRFAQTDSELYQQGCDNCEQCGG